MRMLICLILLTSSSQLAGAFVPDLDERFLESRKQGKWLVEFYAPWCGHCKKLEPIFHQVAASLHSSGITVAKLDCTRYSHVASEFGVKGFPTIKFFHGDSIYTHVGDRTGEDIIEFVNKAKGPAVRPLSSIGRLNEARSLHADDTFYLYVGEDDINADLYTKYAGIAGEQVAKAYFYSGTKRILPEDAVIKTYPTILVFKDGRFYEFEAPKGIATMSAVQQWINRERFPAYPLVVGGGINSVAETQKYLVIFVIDENDPDKKSENERLKEVGRYMAYNEREKYHSTFQFLWMNDPETANSIMMTFVGLPFLLVLDPMTHLYYIPPLNVERMDAKSIGAFLQHIQSGKLEAYGGTGFFQRLKRLFYDLLVTVVSVWQSSRWLFLLMFGLPTGVISIVCYSLCCLETIDDEVHSDDDSDEEDHERMLEEKQEDDGHLKSE